MARQARHYGSREALETRVDYVESSLEKAIARSDLRHDESRKEFKESMQQMELRHKESMTELKKVVEKSEMRMEAMLKDSRSSRNWIITTCIAVLALATTIASGIVGQIFSAIIGSN